MSAARNECKLKLVEWTELEHWGQFNAMFVDAPRKQTEQIIKIAISLDVGLAAMAGGDHVRVTNIYDIWVSGYIPPERSDPCCIQNVLYFFKYKRYSFLAHSRFARHV